MKEMSMSRNSPKAEIQKVLIFSATSKETLWQTILQIFEEVAAAIADYSVFFAFSKFWELDLHDMYF